MATDILRGDFNNIVIMQLRFRNTEVHIGQWVVWKDEIVMHKIGEDLYEVYPDVHPAKPRDLSSGYVIVCVDRGKPCKSIMEEFRERLNVKDHGSAYMMSMAASVEGSEVYRNLVEEFRDALLRPEPVNELATGMTTWRGAESIKTKSHYKEPILKQRRHNIRSTLRR